MEPELQNQVKEWKSAMSEEEAKLLFIRQSASEAYDTDKVVEATKGILKTIVELTIVSTMTKEEIGLHIGRLETARSYLAAFTQGIQIAHAKDIEPKIKAKREKERLAKLSESIKTSGKEKKINEIIELAKRLAEGPMNTAASSANTKSKVHCNKCNQDVWDLEFHNCIE